MIRTLKLTLLCSTVLLSACSTLQYGKQQSITIYTNPHNANCTLKNDLGSTSAEGTPATAYIYPSRHPLLITCQKAGYETFSTNLKSKEKDFSKGVNAGGFLVMSDRLAETTSYSYPNKVDITMVKATAKKTH